MSNPLAHYSFIPWLRVGIGSKISELDALGAPTEGQALERAELRVTLNFRSKDIEDTSNIDTAIGKDLKLIGPPDIKAISSKAIVRMEPKPKVNNYESNGLPYIEFYQEDFLWRFTPANSGTGTHEGKLTPWLALICLKDDEFELNNTADGRQYIRIPSDKIGEVFHSETQHWAWGHVHMNTELEATSLPQRITEVTGELDANPDSGLCRLLCPRKLIKESQYTAFLIPAFETGRLAGLDLEFTGVLAQKMSWGIGEDYSAKPRGTDYPVYHFWSFQTGLHGDFESLARILKPVVTDPELGKRDMFIADAGYGLEDFPPDSTVLGLEGALKPPDFSSDAWPNGIGDQNYREHLRKLLNLSIDHETRNMGTNGVLDDSLTDNPFYSASLADDPMVTPHVYGRWHALVRRLLSSGDNNYPWVSALNLDPRNRATAGLGVSIVQKNQESYMRRAWKQVEQINEANAKIRKGRLSRMVSDALYNKHIRHANEDQKVRLTNPMHRFLKDSDKTVQHSITNSLIPNASKSGAFKKITRPGKKGNRKINAKGITGANLIHGEVIQNFNGENGNPLTAAKEKTAPLLAINFVDVGAKISNAVNAFTANDSAMARDALFNILLTETDFSDLDTNPRKTDLKAKIDLFPSLSDAAKTLAKNLVDGIDSSQDGGTDDSHVILVQETPYKALFGDEITAKTYQNIIISRDTSGAAGVLGRATILADITAFQSAFTGFDVDILGNMVSLPPLEAISNLQNFSAQIAQSLAPKQLIQNRVLSGISLLTFNPSTGDYEKQNIDKLRPIMAYPKFDDPMFRNLKALSQEYILPNIDKVPVNSITLLETNQAFIEAYMAGLNHEMSRELLWREYPTDQRGTYFRQFWDISDNVLEPDPEKKYDIAEMHTWEQEAGDHSPRVITNPSGSRYLVLLIRGDLLKKYPNTQVYAQKAAFKNPASPVPPRIFADPSDTANLKVPVFMAELEPDIYLFGFDLDIDEARGSDDDANDPGWFFALRERPGQIRFGLDDWTPTDPDDPIFPDTDPADWNDLSWEHLVAAPEDLMAYHINAQHSFSTDTGTVNIPLATWGKNSADMAYILYQNPVLFARHAQEMLPD